MQRNQARSTTKSPLVIAIVGPTATGKTALSVAVAAQLGLEIISADSQLVYQGLNIGTAKPTLEERQGIPHYMIDLVPPNVAYTAALYQEQASAILNQCLERQQAVVVTGGTGFYLRALLESSFIPEVAPNPELRAQLAQLAQSQGSVALHEKLAALDPVRANALHPNDTVRIIRALEIIDATGQPVPNQVIPKPFEVRWVGLTYQNRDLHRKKIDVRIAQMLQQGWLEEVETLLGQFGPEAHALGVAHGYPELVRVLQGALSMKEAIAQIEINIHQYARRQMTWFKRNSAIEWFDVEACDLTQQLERVLSQVG